MRSADRQGWQKLLSDRGIQTGIHYPIPVHLQKAYADPRYREGDFPHAEAAAREVLSLPIFPEMTEQQIAEVTTALQRLEQVGAGKGMAS